MAKKIAFYRIAQYQALTIERAREIHAPMGPDYYTGKKDPIMAVGEDGTEWAVA